VSKLLRISPDLSLPLDWMSMATVVYGARGSGKTTMGAVVAEEVTKAKQRFCAIDLKGDWYGLKSTADGKGDGIPVVIFGGEHEDVPLEAAAGAFLGETVAGLSQSCILDFEYMRKGEQRRVLGQFFESLYHHNREPLLLLMDEAQRYAPQLGGRGVDPQMASCLGAVEDIVKLGRKHGLGVVLFTQRGSGLNKEVSELCDMLVAFRTPGPLDQDRIKDWLDANATLSHRNEVMGQLSGLDTGTAVFASGHPDLRIFGKYSVRRRETFDSSSTPKVGQRRKEPKVLAKPELEELREKMAATIERQKADDPKELRRRIIELEKQVKAKVVPVVNKVGKTERIEVKVPFISDKQLRRIESLGNKLGGLSSRAGDLSAQMRQTTEDLRRIAVANVVKAVPATPQRQLPSPAPAPRAALVKSPPKAAIRPLKAPPVTNGAALPAGERAVLIAIAQTPDGVTRQQISILSGYKKSTRNAYLSRLSGAGYVEETGDLFIATEQGLGELGSDFEPLPTGDALREHWLQNLPDGERKVFSVVVDAYPDPVDRDTIGERTEFKKSTRNAYISRLNVRKIIVIARDGVTAAKELFN
jgi:hypothetical protein